MANISRLSGRAKFKAGPGETPIIPETTFGARIINMNEACKANAQGFPYDKSADRGDGAPGTKMNDSGGYA